MQPHRIVSEQEWLTYSLDLLAKEKVFTRLRDELSRTRRELPWTRVAKNYLFDGPNGKQTLGQLFDGRSQLIVYHFMFGPGDEAGCPSCSYLADHFDGALPHLAQRDVTLLAVSRATMSQIEAFRKRMGWKFKWLSSGDCDFNYDYQVSFHPREVTDGKAFYNFSRGSVAAAELPGASVFYKDEWGDVFRTYSTYARGLDLLAGAYNFLDLTPKGRDEDALDFTMSWVRHHDHYEPAATAGLAFDATSEVARQSNPAITGDACCASAKQRIA